MVSEIVFSQKLKKKDKPCTLYHYISFICINPCDNIYQ